MIDFIYPPKSTGAQDKKKEKDDSSDFMQMKSLEDEDLVENVKDDLVDEDGSGLEDQNDDKEKDSAKGTTSSPNVRKRKPRKAD